MTKGFLYLFHLLTVYLFGPYIALFVFFLSKSVFYFSIEVFKK